MSGTGWRTARVKYLITGEEKEFSAPGKRVKVGDSVQNEKDISYTPVNWLDKQMQKIPRSES